MKKLKQPKTISVSARTYERIVAKGLSPGPFVDELVRKTLEDPATAAVAVAAIRARMS